MVGRGRGLGVRRRGRRDGQDASGGDAAGDHDVRADRRSNTVDFKRQADTAEVTVTVEANGPPVAHIAISGCDDGQLHLHLRRVGLDRPGGQHRLLQLGHGGRHDARGREGRARLRVAGQLHRGADGDRPLRRGGHGGHGAGREPGAGGGLRPGVRGAGVHVHEHGDGRGTQHRDLGVGLRRRRERDGLGGRPHLRNRWQLRRDPHRDRQPGRPRTRQPARCSSHRFR